MATMRACVARLKASEGGSVGLVVSVEDVPRPTPNFGRDEALVKVLRAGVCKTDLEIMKGYMGFEGILGHEFVGVVVECPPDRADAFLHKRVCADINVCCNDLVECGVCALPQEGKELVDRMRRNHCPNRSVIGILGRPGCFAEYICLPCRNLHVVEDDISEEDACFAEPLAAALRIVEQKLTRVGRRTAIMGDGKLGLLITAALTAFLRSADSASAPTEVYLFGRHDSKLELLEKMSESSSSSGVTLRLCNVNDDEGKRALKDLAHACDCVVEATGNPHGFTQSCELLKPRGTLVLKVSPPSLPLSPPLSRAMREAPVRSNV